MAGKHADAGRVLDCTAVTGGVTFAVLATPGSSRDGVRGVHGTAVKVALRSPPEKGRANDELVELIAAWLEVPRRQVTLLAGATARKKRMGVAGISVAQIQARLDLLA